MTGARLAAIGRILFGGFYRADFERHFALSNRSLRRMLAGEQPIPIGLIRDLETALRDKANKIDEILETLVDETEETA